MVRRILVMADVYGPLYEWDEAGDLQIADVNQIPISDALRGQLAAWVEDWRGASGQNYGPLRRELAARLRRQGNGMSEALRRELGEDFQVFYAEVPDIGAPKVPDLRGEVD